MGEALSSRGPAVRQRQVAADIFDNQLSVGKAQTLVARSCASILAPILTPWLSHILSGCETIKAIAGPHQHALCAADMACGAAPCVLMQRVHVATAMHQSPSTHPGTAARSLQRSMCRPHNTSGGTAALLACSQPPTVPAGHQAPMQHDRHDALLATTGCCSMGGQAQSLWLLSAQAINTTAILLF
jgi:hypothetical protein